MEYERVPGTATGGGNAQPNGTEISDFPLQPTALFEIIDDITGAVVQVLQPSGSLAPTTPTRQFYLSDIVGREIVVESDVELWFANIYRRTTRYVIAE
jgi:hypothetical protein